MPPSAGAVELKARALRHLARREHSRAELERKLAPHAENPTQLQALRGAVELIWQSVTTGDARQFAEMMQRGREYLAGRARPEGA